MTTAKIQALTDEQKNLLPFYRDKWLDIGLSVEPGNREQAQKAVCEAYKVAGLASPEIFVWLDSPLQGATEAALLAGMPTDVGIPVRAQVRAQVWDQVWDQVRAQVRAQVWDQVRAQVRAQVWDQVRAQVGAQVWDQVRAQVWAQVRAQVWDQVGDQVGAQVGAQVWRCGYGQHDANWLGFYEVFLEACDLKCVQKLKPLMQLAEHSGWWWPFEKLVIFTDKPNRLHRDERGRLHCEDGLAIGYKDGWGVYAWHGVRVPADAILRPDLINVEQIEAERNAEVRRVLIERYGQERYLTNSAAQLIHEDSFGQLYRKELIDDEPLVMVKVVNSTPEPDGHFKEYMLRVPADMKEAREAVAWTFSKGALDYMPCVET